MKSSWRVEVIATEARKEVDDGSKRNRRDDHQQVLELLNPYRSKASLLKIFSAISSIIETAGERPCEVRTCNVFSFRRPWKAIVLRMIATDH